MVEMVIWNASGPQILGPSGGVVSWSSMSSTDTSAQAVVPS